MFDLLNPDVAMLVIFGVSLFISVSYTFLNKKFIYTPDFVRKKETVDRWRKEYNNARMKKDEKRVKQLEKKKEQMNKLQSEISMKTMKLFFVTTIPFWLVYYLLFQTFSPLGEFIALPIPLPLLVWPPVNAMNFFWWYIISSFTFSTLLRKYFAVG